MDKQTQPYTFNNVDIAKGRVIITPRGPDPILLGIRGETAEIVKSAVQPCFAAGAGGALCDFPQ